MPNPVDESPAAHTHLSMMRSPACWSSAAIIAIILYTMWRNPADLLEWKANMESELASLLGSLLIASVIVERVVEVFLSIWKRGEVDLLEQRLEYWQAIQGARSVEIQSLEAKLGRMRESVPPETAKLLKDNYQQIVLGLSEAEKEARKIVKELVPYQAETRRLAMWIGMAVGMLISAVGVRFLSNLVEIKITRSNEQYSWLVMVDVLITGAVLAGGSKGMHRIAAFLGTTISAGEAKAGKQKNTAGTPPTPPVSS